MIIGFIGLGNMGGAVAKAIAKLGMDEILLSDHNPVKAAQLQAECGGLIVSNEEIAARSDVIFLGVKPHLVSQVLTNLRPAIAENPMATWISMAAGVTIAQLSQFLPEEQIIRMMPNTPVAIGQGMTTFTTTNPENVRPFEELMSLSGQVKELPEHLLDAATAIAGCGPAFVYEFIEALTRAGIQNGLTAEGARELASQTVLGTAQMLQESEKHPAQLRDEVTSPGGSTIAGLVALEQAGFAAATIAGVNQALSRTRELGK